jgi:uncharacterized protein YjaG (DUF416 family)
MTFETWRSGGTVIERIRNAIGRGGSVQLQTPADFPAVAYAVGLQTVVAALPDWQQAAFAAACAERLHPAYAAFRAASGTNDDGAVRRALDFAWEDAAIAGVGNVDVRALVERCVRLIPREDADFMIPDHAEYAIAAAAYALEAAAGLREGAAGWAAEAGTNALDSFLLSSATIPWSGETREGRVTMDQRVWRHALVQEEVARREADLERLARGDREAAVRDVRASATNVSLLPLDALDHEPGDRDEQ